MSKIFIFTNSYTTRTMIFDLNYLFNCKTHEILLLKENFMNENYSLNNIKVKLFNNMDNCIEYSDFIIIIKNGNVPKKSINYILSKSKELNKKCIEIQNPWQINSLYSNQDYDKYKEYDFNNCPVILDIALGYGAQQFCVELLLNKIFIDKKINFKQFYSLETKNILLQLNKYNILNNELSKQLNTSINQYNVIIYSINIGDSIYNIKKYIEILRCLKPDFTILQTDIKFEEYETAKKFIKYGCFSQLDILIKSHYNLLYKKHALHCNNHIIKEDYFIKDIESNDLEKKLALEILSKIAFPEGIIKL